MDKWIDEWVSGCVEGSKSEWVDGLYPFHSLNKISLVAEI
jgi:hypothetical protein